MKPLKINYEKCNLCQLCLTQCRRKKLTLSDKKIIINNIDDCIGCGHCYAICPQQAIVPENNLEPETLQNYTLSSENLLFFLRSRRSHRAYQDKHIENDTIKHLIEFGRYAPTGTNSESVEFIFIRDLNKINLILDEIMKTYIFFNRIIQYKIFRFFIGLFDKRIKKAELKRDLLRLVERYKNGEDPIFHKAPLLVFISAGTYTASTPYDDCCYALYNMILGAETLGLSSCINGLAMLGLKFNKKIKKLINPDKNFKIYTCATFGYPKYKYQSFVYRKEKKFIF